MKLIFIFASLLVLASYIQAKPLTCLSTSSTAASKYYCLDVDNSTPTACQQCAAGVKYFCPTSPLLSTKSWRRGIKVLGNCSKIPKYTAIATFPDGVNYSGHAAVLVGCNESTKRINVYDQYAGKMWGPRDLFNLSGTVSNNPEGFYVIEV